MEITPFSQPWIEGFVSEAADLGLDSAQVERLLKQASFLALMGNDDFAGGFREEMQKQAQTINLAPLTKLLWKYAPALALGGLGLYGGQQALNTVQRHWDVPPEMQPFVQYAQNAPSDYRGLGSAWSAAQDAESARAMSNFQRRYAKAQADQRMFSSMSPGQGSPFFGWNYRG